ncbi:MAG: hypothetical protein U0103_03595 [Candidatus Obscuribacterales bacterium]
MSQSRAATGFTDVNKNRQCIVSQLLKQTSSTGCDTNKALVHVLCAWTALGTVIGVVVPVMFLLTSIHGASLASAAVSYASCGGIGGLLVAGFFYVIVHGSLEIV